MKLADFDYTLPASLIANNPIEPRDSCRLMIVNRKDGSIKHAIFRDLPEYLNKDDLLVFNDTKVIPARIMGNKETGGRVEVLVLEVYKDGKVRFISKPGIKIGQKVKFENGLEIEVTEQGLTGETMGNTNHDYDSVMDTINSIGYTPLPHYIHPSLGWDEPKIRQSYQTIYAKHPGSAAAPTAGLHFTDTLFSKLKTNGVVMANVTLHVGLGTFAPVREENIEEHQMHTEYFNIPEETKALISKARMAGNKVVAVGTTTVRTLESVGPEFNKSQDGSTNIFIYPGYKFQVVDAMITNFHLPKSTLLMMVSAFAGKELITKSYQVAIEEKYRFYSFGDAMLIL